MLYPKNTEKELSPELFASPTSEYRGTPFWAWNCRLDRDELLRQIDVLHEMGFGGFHMHVRSGLETEYLGDEFMELIASCVDKAEKEKMLAWLYDEDRWPSGFAGGYVTKDKKYRMRYLLMTMKPYDSESTVSALHINEQNIASRSAQDSVLIAKFDVSLDADGCLASYKRLDENESGVGDVWYAYIESPPENPRYNGYTYANTLDKKAIDRFIETTHEKYKEKVGDKFGDIIPAIFSDEPQTTFKNTLKFATSRDDVTLPFTDDLEKTYKSAYGFSLVDKLPELLWELPDEKISVARYYYHDHIAERFSEAFADTIGDWCRSNKLLLTGHMMKEQTLESQTQASGEAMRSYRGFGMPGIDMLAGKREYTTAKQAQSAVNQMGCEGMLDEIYGVTTWDFDFRGHKLHGDWQAALGVTVRVPHLSWVSMKGEAKRDYPASINYQTPWYKEYSYVEDHFARINTAMTRGVPVVRIGVIHPIESYWLHWGPSEQTALIREQLDRNFANLTEWLLFGTLDFDFICEANLPRYCEKGSAPLNVGQMSYDVVIVPGAETLRSSTLERLEEFVKCGGKLIFMGEAPKYLDAAPSEEPKRLYEAAEHIPFERFSLLSALDPYRLVGIRNSSGALSQNMLYRMRRDGERLWLFIAGGKEPYNKDISSKQGLSITVKGEYSVRLYDTITGEITDYPYSHSNGQTKIPASLYQHDSLLLCLTPSNVSSFSLPTAPKCAKKSLKIPCTVDYSLDEPNMLLLDMAEWSIDDDTYSSEEEILRIDSAVRRRFGWTPWGGAAHQPWYLKKGDCEHVLHLRYTFESEISNDHVMLAMESPENADIRFNSKKVSNVPVSYYVDKAIKTLWLPHVKIGKNVLELSIPYGERTAAEAVYLLGDFGVRTEGYHSVMTTLPKKLCFGNIVNQGLPFYGGKLTYHLKAKTDGGRLTVTVPQYRASVLRVTADRNESKIVAYSPYSAAFELEAGEHDIDIAAYIPRTNGFGPLHYCDDKNGYQSPSNWRSTGDKWCYGYRFKAEGITVSPRLEEAEDCVE